MNHFDSLKQGTFYHTQHPVGVNHVNKEDIFQKNKKGPAGPYRLLRQSLSTTLQRLIIQLRFHWYLKIKNFRVVSNFSNTIFTKYFNSHAVAIRNSVRRRHVPQGTFLFLTRVFFLFFFQNQIFSTRFVQNFLAVILVVFICL